MNKKLFLFLLIPTVIFAKNPKSIHWSALGDYLVDQDGHRTHIEGHPWMRCYIGNIVLAGWFVREVHSKVILQSKNQSILVDKPVCDVYGDK